MNSLFISDPTFAGTFYTGAGFIAEINANPNCVYYTSINQDHKTLELVECIPGEYSRVVLVSYSTLNRSNIEDDMDYSDTASYRLALFLNGRRKCALTKQSVDEVISKPSDERLPYFREVTHIIPYGIKMRVSTIIDSRYLSEGDNPEECIADAINVAVSFSFKPIGKNKRERNN
jgi:hypothetical protein